MRNPIVLCLDNYDKSLSSLSLCISPIMALLASSLLPSAVLLLLLFLHQIELLQVVSEDGVFDGHEDEADVFRVRGAGEVRVQRLVLFRVLFLVHFQDEFLSCSGILLRSCKSRSLFQYAECNFCTHAVVLIKTCKHPGKSY